MAKTKQNKIVTPKRIDAPSVDAMDDESLLRDVVEKVDQWYSYFNEHIDRARNFLNFLYVDQWEQTIKRTRESLSKPTLTFNKLTPIIRAILGEQRQNSPNLAVRSLSEHTPQNAVDLRTDLIRQISYASDADIVYQIASKHMLECGWGAARVIIRYENENSFDQCLGIEPIVDFQSAFFDPTAQKPDKSDGDYCGVYTVMSKEDFKRFYPEVENPQSAGNNYYLQWETRETVTVAEMFYKDYYKKTIAQLSDGNIVDVKDAKEIIRMQEDILENNPELADLDFESLKIVNQREVTDYSIKHIKFVQNQILERTDWPGKLLPIVFFEGDSVVIDGQRIPIPYIQDAIDTQKLINYFGSEIAYGVLTSRREQFMGTPDNFEGHEEIWRNPQQVQGALIANPDKDTQAMPQMIAPQPFQMSLIQALQQATQDLQQVLGRYEEARGEESNAISGIAIAQRKQASNWPVNVFQDNWQRGIKQIGKVMLDLITPVYNTERTVVTRTLDGKAKPVMINQKSGKFRFSNNGDMEEVIDNDITQGDYDIEVRVDGSFDVQNAQAMNILLKLASINPAISNLISDLIAEVSGLENTQKLVERLKTLLPPDILAKEEGKPPPQPPQQPPNPMLMLQMQKIQNERAQLALKEKQLMHDQEKLQLEAQKEKLNTAVAFKKSYAEMKKAELGLQEKMVQHVTQIQKSNQPGVSP